MEENKESRYLSREGFEKLKEELYHLKSHQRREIAERLESAKGLGDIRENAEYQSAKDEQISNESRIARIEGLLAEAILISEKKPGLYVGLGSTVTVKKENNSLEEKYTIVGSEEADPFSKKISNSSPLGRALLGKKRGDRVAVYTPKGEVKYAVIDIL